MNNSEKNVIKRGSDLEETVIFQDSNRVSEEPNYVQAIMSIPGTPHQKLMFLAGIK